MIDLNLFIPVLKYAAEQMAEETCDDREIENTPAARAFWRAMSEWGDPEDEGEWTLVDLNKEGVCLQDSTTLDFLVYLIESGKLVLKEGE